MKSAQTAFLKKALSAQTAEAIPANVAILLPNTPDHLYYAADALADYIEAKRYLDAVIGARESDKQLAVDRATEAQERASELCGILSKPETEYITRLAHHIILATTVEQPDEH